MGPLIGCPGRPLLAALQPTPGGCSSCTGIHSSLVHPTVPLLDLPTCRRLQLRSPRFGGGQLPDISPGALPALTTLEIGLLGKADSFRPTLPPSWGAGPDVLPSLRQLTLQLPISGPLPQQWAAGFPRLWMLWLSSEVVAGEGAPDLDACRLAAATERGQPELRPERELPGEWATGFPALQHLELNCLHIGGSLPHAWAAGGFPSLQTM